jgi:predicted Zn-dependent peptidase
MMNDTQDTTLDRTRPPQPGPPRDVRFPDYVEAVLPNGLKVIVYEESFLPMVSMNLVFRGGASGDAGYPGLASLSAETLTKGTPSRSATRIVEEIESLGGSIGSGAGWDSLSIGVGILSRNLEHAIDVIADVVRNANYPVDEIERVREQRLALILQQKANPSALAYHGLCRAVYGSHPYGQPSDGTEDAVRAMQRDHMVQRHAAHCRPGNGVLIAVGDVSAERILPLVENYFGGWERGAELGEAAATGIPAAERVVHVVDRPTAVQSSILVGHSGIPRNHADHIPVHVMNTLLGGYFGSRLNLNLREDKGFTYGAHSRFEGRMQAGPFSAGAEVRNEVTGRAIEEILAEMQKLVQERVRDEELESVKQYITGNFPIQIETPTQVAQRITAIELYGLGKDYYNTYNSRVMALTADDIRHAAQTYLHPDTAAIVAAGRGDVLRSMLEQFGAVQVFDADGQIIHEQ